MGIVGFQKWLLGSFPEAVTVQSVKAAEHYDHVAFDMNQIIHQNARKATSRPTLASAMFRDLDLILKNCIPRKSVFFACDGPAPLAKLMTQRKRRNKARKEYTDAQPQSLTPNSRPSKYARPAIDRLEVTPGVELLYFIRDALQYWAYSRLQNDRKYANVDIRISGPDVPGEGELKLIDFCRSNTFASNESIVVVGGDADIVLQGLATIPVRNFFVYLRRYNAKENYVISVWELVRTLEKRFPNESSGVRIDFILFSILNGNDYVPKVRGMSIPRLWRRYIYLKTARSSTASQAPFQGQCVVDAETRTFNWPFFYALVDRVGVRVEDISRLQASNTLQRPGSGIQQEACTTSNDSNIVAEEEIVYTGNEDGVPMDGSLYGNGNASFDKEDGYYNMSDDSEDEVFDPDKQHIETLVAISGDSDKYYNTERWLRALLWTLQMYIDGFCGDYTFLYGKPYGPSSEAILSFINDHNGDPFTLHASMSNTPPLLPHQAAMAMLPRHAAHLLPKPLQAIVKDAQQSKKIFLANGDIDINEMLSAIEKVPRSAYTAEEWQRTVEGAPLLLRRARTKGVAVKKIPKPPGPRFESIRPFPVISSTEFEMTSAPPCYAWPSGAFQNTLKLAYKRVNGVRLNKMRPG